MVARGARFKAKKDRGGDPGLTGARSNAINAP